MAAGNLLRACAPLCWVGRGQAPGRRCAAPGVVIWSLFTPHCGVATSPRELSGVRGGKRPGAAAGLSSASCGRGGRGLAGLRRPGLAFLGDPPAALSAVQPGYPTPPQAQPGVHWPLRVRRRLRGFRRRDAPVSAPAVFSLVPLKRWPDF